VEDTALAAALAADQPVLLWGPPGTGKTSVITAVAAKMGAVLETLIGSTIDPTDLARPVLGEDGEVRLSAAPWARRLRQALDRGQAAILFMDELSTSPPAVQAALLRVAQERRVGEIDLTGCHVIAAANPIDQSAGGWDLAAPMANRWLHLDWRLSPERWCAGEQGGWGKARPEAQALSAALVSSYITHRPTELLACPTDPVQASRGWPSPRAWSNVIRALSVLGEEDMAKAALSSVGGTLIRGLVGEAASLSFRAWAADQDLPHPRDVLDGTKDLPERADRQRAAVESVIAYALNRDTPSGEVWAVLAKTRKDVRVALGRTYLNAAEAAKKEVTFPQEFSDVIKEIRGVSTITATVKKTFDRDAK
jgi:hypothetical protein